MLAYHDFRFTDVIHLALLINNKRGMEKDQRMLTLSVNLLSSRKLFPIR